MKNLLRVLKGATEVLTTTAAVLAAAIVVVETYEVLRKKLDAAVPDAEPVIETMRGRGYRLEAPEQQI